MTDRMSALDAFFIYAENDGVNHQHLAGLLLLEGPPPPFEDLLAMIRGKMPVLRRYRQVVKQVPLHLGRPVWVDDPTFDLEYHVRQTALPAPGGEEQLEKLFARVVSQRLDPSRPLWELWSVEGLSDGRWALLTKTHHAMVDGVSASDLITVLFDRSSDARPPAEASWNAAPVPSDARLLADAVGELAASPLAQLRAAVGVAKAPQQVLTTISGVASVRRILSGGSPSLNGPIGPNRRYKYTSYPLSAVKEIRRGVGGTVNDIVLAATARGFRDLLRSRGEALEDRAVRVLVPIALHARDATGRAVHEGDGRYENKVTGAMVDLPVGLDDPLERARIIRERMEALKVSDEPAAADTLTRLSGFAPATFLSLGIRAAASLPPQNWVNSVVTNVPGPQIPLYAVGRRMLACYPYPPLFPIGSRTGVAIWSYNGTLHFGVSGDFASVPDIYVLRDGIQAGFVELHELAQGGSHSS